MLKRIQVEREARAYVVMGEWEKAIALYRELLDEGEDSNIYNLIGDVYVRMGNLADALPEYLRAIELYETEGLFENGIAVCKKVLRLIPGCTELYFSLAIFYSEIGLLNESLEAIKHYAQSSPRGKEITKKPARYKKLITLLAGEAKLKTEIAQCYLKLAIRDKESDAIFGDTLTTLEQAAVSLEEKKEPPAVLKPVPEKVSEDNRVQSLEEKEDVIKEPEIPVTESIKTKDKEKEEEKKEVIREIKMPPADLIKPKEKEEDKEEKKEEDKEEVVRELKITPTPSVKPREEMGEKEHLAEKAKTGGIKSMVPPVSESNTITSGSSIADTFKKPKSKAEDKQSIPAAGQASSSDSITEDSDLQVFLHAIEELKVAGTSQRKRDHYKMGVDYKNLGFYDAAIKEFQLSVASQKDKKLQSLAELGYCFLEKGKPDVAINAFSRALSDEEKTDEDYYKLKYGIGIAYETLGDKKEAINIFEEIYLYNVDYLDVKDRLSKLKSTAS